MANRFLCLFVKFSQQIFGFSQRFAMRVDLVTHSVMLAAQNVPSTSQLAGWSSLGI